ncbi:ABC transporter permease [Actinocorallia sp. A-T 12471]|uniref:ABC transporter permease n=1 Tax=Actinocorallia sp. A-T 12471 TaxID=3089813 RepID=UPI0029D14FE9|nr:ABC transporter permease [Actinocorallia sp. A-T 12471]MDX6744240.1 ABC transporter permease [Actinocorallia sp. A-T 12471]
MSRSPDRTAVPRYLAGRLLQAAVVVWAAFTVVFAIQRLVPGDPVELMLSGRNGFEAVPPEDVARVRAELGFDRPIIVQYLDAAVSALRGDFGTSIQTGRPVAAMIAEALPATLELGLTALALSVVAGIVLAVAANLPRGGAARALPGLAVSLPSFLVGLVLIQLFALRWPLLPSLGGSGLPGLVLPACTLAIPGAALVGQVLGRSLAETLREPYCETLRATGASRTRVVLGHGLRNAAIPAVTVAGVLTGGLIGGAVVVETVFSRQGIGRIVQFAVSTQDLPVVQGVVVVAAAGFAGVNLAIDLLYPVLDPRTVRRPAQRVRTVKA